MTATPPLRRRVVVLGVAVVAATLLVVNTAVFGVLRARLDDSVDQLLRERAALVQAEAGSASGLEELVQRLQARGLRVTVTGPDGRVLTADPASPTIGRGLVPPRGDDRVKTLTATLEGGASAQVYASTAGVEQTLRQLVALQAGTSLVGLGLAALLLGRAARRALRPVADIAAAATRTAGGRVGERLRPDQPTTELGRMAQAYDEMLDALESSMQQLTEAHGARALLAAVVEGSTDAIAVQDLDGTVLTWNTAAEHVLGWPAEQVVGRHVSLVVPEEELPQLASLVAEVVADGGVRGYEGERLTRAGTHLPVSVRLSPVRDDESRIVAVAVGARDITEQRWMASTLDSTLAALQAAADDAAASEEATRRFLADAAHQLRTPVAGIRACAETLLRGASPEDVDRLLATMVRETTRAGRLITSLLQMARLDRGLPLAMGPVDIVTLCREEVERLGLLSPDLQVRLELVAAPPGPVDADPAACREILSNLGDNARRHAATRVSFAVAGDDGSVAVAVRDDGPGLPDDARDRVFERFVSLDDRGGSGLGLPIARGLARAMGGDLVHDDGFVLRLGRHEGTGSEPSVREVAPTLD